MTPCGLVDCYNSFGGPYRFHPQGDSSSEVLVLRLQCYVCRHRS
jgi:ribosomal protein L44E